MLNGIWITVDPSLNNIDGSKKPEDRGLGNKGGLLNDFIFSELVITWNGEYERKVFAFSLNY